MTRPRDHSDVFMDHFLTTLDELIEDEAAHKFLVPLLQGETDPAAYPEPVRKMLTSICVDSLFDHGEDFACDNFEEMVFTNILDSLDSTAQCNWRDAIATQASHALVTMLEDRRTDFLNHPKKRRAAK